MAAFFLALFLFLHNPSGEDSLSMPEKQSRQQVRLYAEAIQKNNSNSGLNVWALVKVSRSSPKIKKYAREFLSKPEYNHPSFDVIRDTSLSYAQQIRKLSFLQKSPVLLVEYLLAEANASKKKQTAREFSDKVGYPSTSQVNYQALVQALLNKTEITPKILEADQFHPLHFFLFFETSIIRGSTFSEEYLRTAGNRWNFSHNNTLKQSMATGALFMTYFALDRYSNIEPLYQPIINNIYFPNSLLKLNLFRWLDYSMYRLGYYNRSLDLIRSYSQPLAKYLSDENLEINLQIKKGAYLYRIGKIEESKKVYKRIQAKGKAQNISYSKARVLNNLAINYWKSGEFVQYLNLEFRALEQAKKETNYKIQQKALRNLFTHYRINKDYDSAVQYLGKAKKLAQKEQNKRDLAQLAYYEGQLLRDTKSNLGPAIAAFDKALNLISYDGHYRSYQNILTEKAVLLQKQQKHAQAREIFNRVLQNSRERNDERNELYASFNIANTYLSQGQTDAARAILDTLQNKNLDALDFYQLVKAKTVQARLQKNSGHLRTGANVLKPVIAQIVSRSRSSGDLETGFWQVEPEYLNAFELYANLLIGNNQPEQAVEALDRLKTINDAALYQNPLVRSKILNEKELSEYKRLTDDLDRLRKKLLAAPGDQREEIQQKIDKKNARKSIYDRRLSARANINPLTVRQVQLGMDAHQRVLHITALNGTYYLGMISRTSVGFTKVPITDRLQATFEESIKEIANGNTDLNNLYAITQFLGISRLPSHVDELTIIPDRYLYQIPLDVLPIEKPANSYSYGSTTYLIEKFETNYMTSLNDFRKNSKEAQYQHGYVGYGVSEFDKERQGLIPLPAADNEIKTIANQLTELTDIQTFVNAEATEQAFRAHASNARILHLASHSEVMGQNPLFSSFYLNRSETDNHDRYPGRIFAYELFNIQLDNELVMLNSCESGSGSYLQGTGIVGISRALRYAGAESLVLNIWSVNDMMASEFAVKFYEGINEGQSKSEALRNAKLYFLQNKNANPHYWGSYMLLGDKEAIIKPHQLTNNIVAASFILFFLTIAAASSVVEMKRRRKRQE